MDKPLRNSGFFDKLNTINISMPDDLCSISMSQSSPVIYPHHNSSDPGTCASRAGNISICKSEAEASISINASEAPTCKASAICFAMPVRECLSLLLASNTFLRKHLAIRLSVRGRFRFLLFYSVACFFCCFWICSKPTNQSSIFPDEVVNGYNCRCHTELNYSIWYYTELKPFFVISHPTLALLPRIFWLSRTFWEVEGFDKNPWTSSNFWINVSTESTSETMYVWANCPNS